MKVTDFALIFIGVALPIIIIVYVNVSFTIKAEEQEIYYKKIINTALRDATEQMKEVESTDAEIDYGYSGSENNKVSVNAQIGVDTFLNSLYNNFGIKGNAQAEQYLQYFIPAIAVIDYNGVYISSVQKYDFINDEGEKEEIISHVLNPKRYYTYEYSIYKKGTNDYKIVEGTDSSSNSRKPSGYTLVSTHTIEFTMDDYVTHRGSYKNGSAFKDIGVKSFYITDSKNNGDLYYGIYDNDLKNEIVELLQKRRTEVIAATISKEMEYATNNNNYYAASAGIQYSFSFPGFTDDEMQSQINNVGIVAFVQGISVGNKYLNAKAFSTSKLTNVTRLYLSLPINGSSKYNMRLYHKDVTCPEYRVSDHYDITPSYVFTKQQAASVKAIKKISPTADADYEGFYPCPICNP